MKTLIFRLALAAAICAGTFPVFAQTLEWRPFGHIHSAQESGFAVTPNGGIFMATQPYFTDENGALFFSKDHGVTWQVKYAIPTGLSMYSLAALNDTILLAWVDQPTNWGGPRTNYGLVRSSDGGISWHYVSGYRGSIVSFTDGLVSFADGTAVLLTDSLYRTTDLGLTWNKILSPPLSASYWTWRIKGLPGSALAVYCDSDYYLGQNFSITTDFDSWRMDTLPHSPMTDILVTPSGQLYAIGMPIYVSNDFGNSWVVRDSLDGRPVAFFKNGSVIGVGAFTGPTNNPPLFAVTQDSFKSWQRLQFDDYGPSSSSGVSFGLDSSDATFLAGGGGLYRITDTSLWGIDCAPDHNSVPYIAASPNGTIACSDGWAEITSDNGWTWKPLDPGANQAPAAIWYGDNPVDGFIAETLHNYPTILYLLHSKDGFEWDTSNVLSMETQSLLGFDRAGDIFAGKDSQISVTTDLGQTWEHPTVSPGAEGTPAIIGLPDGSCISAANGGIYHSTDLGLTWTFIPSNKLSQRVRSVACDSSGNIMVAMDSVGAYLSTDLGAHWNSANAGIDSVPNQILYSSEGFWLAATGDGVFRMPQDDSAWLPDMDGLDGLGVLSIAMVRPGYYLAGTTLAGIYATDTTTIIAAVLVAENKLSGVSLSAFPNPSQQSLSVAFQVPHSGYLELRLFNSLGESVKEIYNQNVTSGSHQFSIMHGSLPRWYVLFTRDF